ncbi:MAG: class I tRNA ligase family protein, partial [Deltaproteobacteria bacterium]|nr:class I tRNA ligase family protein [Deltaproteobacteria bacterium]
MIMQGLKFMGDVPFKDIYIHGLIRDEKGQKMSKTSGNVIDPLEVIDEYGADAMRFSLTALATQGRDIKLSMPVIQGYRNFINKIWNASRFSMMNLEGYDPDLVPSSDELSTYDKWILTKLNRTIKEVERALESYEFDKSASSIYQFFWAEYCDWYLELVKPILYGDNEEDKQRTRSVLVRVLTTALGLLHPIAPFVSEELYQRLKSFGVQIEGVDGGIAECIVVSAFPEFNESEVYTDAEHEVEFIKEIVAAIRGLRALVGLHPSERVNIILLPDSDSIQNDITPNRESIIDLASLSGLELIEGNKPEKAIAQIIPGVEVFLPVEGLIDIEKESQRIKKEIGKVTKDLKQTENKLSNSKFLDRAPDDIIEKEKEKFEEFSTQKKKLEEVLSKLNEIR